MLFLLFASFAQAAPVVNESKQPYTIYGMTEDDLRLQMSQLGPADIEGQRFDASTHWYVKWRYEYRMVNQYCVLNDVFVQVDIVYHYPKWVNNGKSDTLLQKKWQNYLANLEFHERGHGETGKSAGKEIEKALLKLTPMTNCKELETMADNQAYQIISEHNTRDIRYDLETNHGVTQGAFFP